MHRLLSLKCRPLLWWAFALASPLVAQIPSLPFKPAAVAAAAAEKPEETEARLQSWPKEARTAFAQA